jgi:hypothetical protein
MPPKKTTNAKVKTTKLSSVTPSGNVFTIDNMKLYKLVESLTKSIDSLNSVQESFNQNYEELKNYQNEEFNNMDYQLKLKNESCYEQYNQIVKDFKEKEFVLENEHKMKLYNLEKEFNENKDNFDREIAKHKFEKARVIIEKENFVVLESEIYDKLVGDKENYENTLANQKATLEKDFHAQLNARLLTKELEHKVASSDMKATIQQQTKDIERLESTIETLKQEIQAQRKLTESVAASSQKAVTQNFGK